MQDSFVHTHTDTNLIHYPRTISLAELYDMARQYSNFRRHPAHLIVRFEQLHRNFNGTAKVVLETTFPTHQIDRLLSEVQKCNLATWTEESHLEEPAKAAHITRGRVDDGTRDALVRHLMEIQAIRDHLCLLAFELDYHLEPNCMQKGIVT